MIKCRDDSLQIHPGQIRNLRRRLTLRLDAPDAATCLVTVRMCAGNFVVRDDLVVPIDNIEIPVGAEAGCHGAEPRVSCRHEVFLLDVGRPAVLVLRHRDHLDSVGDRVGDVESTTVIVVFRKFGIPVVGNGNSAQSGAAHDTLFERRWNLRGIGSQLFRGSGRVMGARQELGHGNPEIIGFLEENFPIAIGSKPPDVVRAGGKQFEVAAVAAETRQLALVESDLLRTVCERFSIRAAHFGFIEKTLCDIHPSTRCVFKLVGEKVRVLDTETFENRLVFLRLPVVVTVDVVADFLAILDEGTLRARQDSQGDYQPVGKDTRSMRTRAVWIVEYKHLVLPSAFIQGLGLGTVFVRIHGIFPGGHRPHFSRGIPG